MRRPITLFLCVLVCLAFTATAFAQMRRIPIKRSTKSLRVLKPVTKGDLGSQQAFSKFLQAEKVPSSTAAKDLAAFKRLPGDMQKLVVESSVPATLAPDQAMMKPVIARKYWMRIDPNRLVLVAFPRISSFYPPDGAKGEVALAIGRNFRSNTKIYFNNSLTTTYPITFWGTTLSTIIGFRVPSSGVSNGSSYPVYAKNGTVKGNTKNFMVVAPRGYRGKYGWKVSNSGGPTIPWAVYRNYFGASAVEFPDGTHRPAAESWYHTRYKGVGGGGNCYGMSLSSLRVKHWNLTGLLHASWFVANREFNVWWYDTNRNNDPVWQTVLEMQGNQVAEPQHTLLWDRINNQSANAAWTMAKTICSQYKPHGCVMAVTRPGAGHAVVPYRVGPDGPTRQFIMYDNNNPYRTTETGGPDPTIGTNNRTANTFSWGSYNKVGIYDLPELLVAPSLPAEAIGGGMGLASQSSYLSVAKPARVNQITDELGNVFYVNGRPNTGRNQIPGAIQTEPLGGTTPRSYPNTWLFTRSNNKSFTMDIRRRDTRSTAIQFVQKGLVADLSASGRNYKLTGQGVNSANAKLVLANPSNMTLQNLKLISIASPTEQRSFQLQRLNVTAGEGVEIGLTANKSALKLVNRTGQALTANVRLLVDKNNLHNATRALPIEIGASQSNIMRPESWQNIGGQNLTIERQTLTGTRLKIDRLRP